MTMADIEDVLLALEKSNLVPPAFVARLRMEVTKSPPPHDPRQLIKFLVDKGHITAAQGERLLLAPQKIVAPPPQAEEPYINLDDDLGLAPLVDEPAPRKSLAPPPIPARPSPGKSADIKAEPARTPVAPTEQVYELEVVEEEVLSEADVVVEALKEVSDDDLRLVEKKRPRRSVWDSPLLVLGGGGLALLLLVTGGLLWSLFRTSGEDALALAESDYKSGAYTQAIAKVDAYLADYSNHKDVSKARVMRGLAMIRRHVEGARDWPAALDAAKTALVEISGEDAFPQSKAELAGLLPEIAEGLAAQAADNADAKLVAQANEALSLVKQHVPAAIRNAERLEAVSASLEVTQRTLARENRLLETIRAVNVAAEKLQGTPGAAVAQHLAAAYGARRELLKEFPKLADNLRLAEAMKQVSQAEIGAVTTLQETRDATTEEDPPKVRATLMLAARPVTAAGGGDPPTIEFATASGSITALNAATGEPLWRRMVGPASTLSPFHLAGASAGDALIADNDRQELLRIESATGKLRWRLAVDEPFDAAPTLFGNELLLAMRSGKLYRIQLLSGKISGGWQLAHALSTAPAADVRKKLVYQLGAHSNLYVLSTEAPACREVLYLGHESGSILTPPLAVSRYLMIGENTGLKDSQLRVIQTDEAGLQLTAMQTEPLGGHVDTPPVVDGRMLHVATDRGGLYTFEIGAPGQGKALARVAQRAATLEEPLTHFPLVNNGRLWVAGSELARYSIQSTSGKLAPDGVSLEQSIFLQPLESGADALLAVRRPAHGRGVSAAAIRPSNREIIWETTLSMPCIGGVFPAKDGQSMILLDVGGTVFHIAPAELGRGGFFSTGLPVRPWPETIDAATMADAPLPLDDGSWLYTIAARTDQLLSVAVDGSSRWVSLPEALTSPPERFRGGVALAGQEGRVYVIDPARASNVLEPHQPRVPANQTLRRFGPVAVDDLHLLTGDEEGKLFLLVVKNEPLPHLEIERDVTLAEPIHGAPVVLGKFAFAVNARDDLAAFALPSLEQVQTWALDGRPLWGPKRIGDRILLVTATNELGCWNEAGELAWKLPLQHGPLSGPPIARQDELVLLTKTGVVLRVSADGAELAHVETGQSLLGAGAVIGEHVMAPGSDGALHLIALP